MNFVKHLLAVLVLLAGINCTSAQCNAYFTYVYAPALSQPEQDIYFFSDSSTGEDSSTTYNWNFGTGDFSTLQNPAFTYEPDDSGYEQVCLTIHNTDNNCTSQYCDTIRVDNLCIGARFTYDMQGNTCIFKANICGQWDSIRWSFGDSTFSTQGDSIAHTYPAVADSYYVCVQVAITSECGYFYPCKSIDCQEIHIYPTAINNISPPDRSLKVYPDPASNYISISSSEVRLPAVVKITDIAGNQLISQLVETSGQQILVSDLAAGIYFVQMENKTGQNLITRFVKQ